jgi:peptidoglycan/xylan/chitin deacetylase (PgdA/CDA1 family)
VTDYIGKKSTWREDGTSVELFTATDLRTLISSGFDVQLHGASHCSLDKSSNSLIENETFGAAAALEDLLGRKVSAFAYPFGRFDENSRRIINERFDVGFSTVKSTEIDWRWRNDAIRRTYIPPNCDYEHVLSLLEAYRNSSDAEFIEMYS